MQSRHAVLICAAALALVSAIEPAAAQVEDRRSESKQWRIRISAPEGWRMSTQATYPNVVVWMYRKRPPGTMLLTAEHADGIGSARQYERTTVAQLEALGYRVETERQVHTATQAYWIEFDDGETFFRQAFLVTGGVAYSLTLSAPDRRARAQHLRAFDHALRSMEPIGGAAPREGEAGLEAIAGDDAMCASSPVDEPLSE